MKACITGIGWVTSHGIGRGGQQRDFALSADHLKPLSRKDIFSEPNQRFGRQSEYSKLGLAAIALALRDAGHEEWSEKRPVGIVASTQLGCLSTDLDYFDTTLPQNGGLPSPNLFAYTLANCFLGEAAIQFGLTGSGYVVNETSPEGVYTLRAALETLLFGECNAVLAGFCDFIPVSPLPGINVPLPGALFMMLESNPNSSGHGYGTLTLAEDDSIRHSETEIHSVNELIKRCLA